MFGISSLLRALLGNQPLFTIEAGGADLRVVRFHGQEGISSLFGFRLELAGPEIDVGALVDKPAALRIEGIDAPRFIHGVLSEFEYVGESRSLQLYEAELVPWIWRLQHRQDCRIFQDKPTPKILEEVLTGAGLAKDWLRFDLVAEYAPRNYCVQYHETDLAFLMRLMEEDGIFYFFEHEGDKHVLVMADHPGAHKPIPGSPAVWFSPPGGDVADREHVREFRFGQRVKPGKASLRDFNIHKPDLPMEVNEAGKLNVDLEVYHYPGEYQDPSLGTPDKGLSIAKTRLEAHQAFRRSGGGTSDCPRLTAGHTFELMGHPRSDLETTYRVTHVTHAGSQPQVLDQDAAGEFSYSNEFGVTEKSQPFRAAQRTPKPQMRGLQTATVVGPEGEEVHPDEHGRVKVQFHWDRAEPFDETSSCWVRVSQLWAGAGWGAMFIPRIGHEVLIDFIEGDPDRPVIVGRLYTGNNKPPYELPAHKTRSTIKSESSLGGGGFNEFRFEDLKGGEEIFLHAQKDWNTIILNNLTESVGVNRTSTIGSIETISVGSNRSVSVGKADATSVGVVHSVTMAQAQSPPPSIPATGIVMTDKFHQVTTGEATITMQGPDIVISAVGNISITAGGMISIAAGSGDLILKGGPNVHINPPPPPPPEEDEEGGMCSADEGEVSQDGESTDDGGGSGEPVDAETDEPIAPHELFDQLDFEPEGSRDLTNALMNPIDAVHGKSAADEAFAATAKVFPGQPARNNEADAFRHALWNYRMTQAIGAEEAKKIADAHERGSGNAVGETMMDLFNNQVGRDLALDPGNVGRDPSTVVLEAIQAGKIRTSPFNVKP